MAIPNWKMRRITIELTYFFSIYIRNQPTKNLHYYWYRLVIYLCCSSAVFDFTQKKVFFKCPSLLLWPYQTIFRIPSPAYNIMTYSQEAYFIQLVAELPWASQSLLKHPTQIISKNNSFSYAFKHIGPEDKRIIL